MIIVKVLILHDFIYIYYYFVIGIVRSVIYDRKKNCIGKYQQLSHE